VKTLTAKLPYKEVHKASGFLANDQQQQENGGSSQPKNHQQQQQEKSINVAVVAPFMMPTQKQPSTSNSMAPNGINNKSMTAQSSGQNEDSISAKYDSINGSSLLPPPSQLLLSGFNPTKTSPTPRNGSHFQYQPIFDISGLVENF
jgi:hypothetical protein